MTGNAIRESAVEHHHEENKTVLSEFKEDLKVTMAFVNALKRKVDDLYQKVFGEDPVDAGGKLEGTLGIVGTMVKKGCTLKKVTEYQFVKDDDSYDGNGSGACLAVLVNPHICIIHAFEIE